MLNKELNVLSLFNGMGCIWLALDKQGIKVNKRYSSEIDKYAIKVNDANYPDTIQLGSVVNVDISKLENIDVVVGGSPCQSFSMSGKRKGMSTKDEQEVLTLEHYLQLKQDGFEFEGQSYLFWEYMRILIEIKKRNPEVKFMLENVMMGKKWEKVLTKAIGVNPIEINSSLLSAQNRERLYWTNIGLEPNGFFGDLESIILKPKDKGVLLKDVLEVNVNEKYYLSEKIIEYFLRHSEKHKEKGTGFGWNPTEGNRKAAYVRANGSLCATDNIIIDRQGCVKFGRTAEAKSIRKKNMQNGKDHTPFAAKEIVEIDYDKMNTITTTPGRDNLIFTENKDDKVSYLRRLTPIECERLQTVPDNYTSCVSDSQRYKMIGNGWTVDVISHILSYLNK